MKREIYYWKWNEKYNHSIFKLGDDFSTIESNRLLLQDKYNPKKYHVLKGLPDYIIINSNKISEIFFERNFLKFNEKDIWELAIEDFKTEMSKYLEPCGSNYKGDILRVLFRDIFTGFAEIKRM